MTKWEYLIIGLEPSDANKKLDDLGEKGWELVAVTSSAFSWCTYCLKRIKQ